MLDARETSRRLLLAAVVVAVVAATLLGATVHLSPAVAGTGVEDAAAAAPRPATATGSLGVALASSAAADPTSSTAVAHAATRTESNRPAGVRTNSTAAGDAVETSGGSGDAIEVTQRLFLTPERAGSYDARTGYRIPEQVVSLEVTLPRDATVVGTDGFSATDDRTLAWDGATASPSFRVRMPANRTVDRDDPIAGPGDYLFVDVGDWAIVQRPLLGHSWSFRGSTRVGLHHSTEADSGVAGDVLAYLGDAETYERSASGQRFVLVEPAAADLAEDREAVLDELAYGADALRIGDRDDEVLVVAAPTGDAEWGVRGLQTGTSDVWVRDFEPLDDVNNVWLHEYAHTRQDWTQTPTGRWLTEATASYYASLLTMERDGVSFDQFSRRLERGEASVYDDAVLRDPGTWRENPEYNLGALVTGEIDRRIRLATDGERSLQDVLRAINDPNRAVDEVALSAAVDSAGGGAIADAHDAFVDGSSRPQMWSRSEHEAAFGTLPARIGYRATDPDDPFAVTGPYRDRSLGADRIFVPGETVSTDVTVENAGETAGDYEATLRLDDVVLDAASGRIEPGAATRASLDGALTEPGQYTLRAGDARYPVEVREPATADVTALRMDSSAVGIGEPVAVHVTLANDADWPARRDLALVANGRVVHESTVHLDAREERTVARTVRFSTPGTRTITARDSEAAGATIDVTGLSIRALLGVALVAAVLVGLAVAYRRRS